MPTTDQKAIAIRHKAKEYGLTVQAHDQIVSVTARFEPGDKQAFNQHEARALEILGMFRQVRPGSTWGTDGVGGAIALEKGLMIISRSGMEKALASKFYNRY